MALQLSFREDKAFYAELDAAVREGKAVCITLGAQKLGWKSKLWKRLRRASNWGELERDIRQFAGDGAQSRGVRHRLISALVSRQMAMGLTAQGGQLIAWIASLLAAIIFYAIYKGYSVVLETTVDPVTREVRGKLTLKPRGA